MKKMRTIITVLLALVMAVSAFSVYAEETATTTTASGSVTFSDVEQGTLVHDAVKKLVGYRVITGYEDGTFKPDNTITRAEFAAVITRFKGLVDDLPTSAVTGFSDLDNDSDRAWARPYVKIAVDAGIINGFDDGTFRAAEPVTYEQAVKMLICAVGYEPIANSEYNKLKAINSANLTWSSGYISAAMKNGITKGAYEGIVTNPATRGTVAILTSNAYEVPELESVTDEHGNTSYEQGGGSVENEKFDEREKIVGIVVANHYTSLEKANSGLESNEITISDSRQNTTYELSSELMERIDVNQFIGKRVAAYYAKDEFGIVDIEEYKNEIVKIDESQVIHPLEGNSISYYNGRKKDDINVNDYTFIYNGKSEYIEDLRDLEYEFKNGYIEVNQTTNVVNIVSYDVMVVNSYNRTAGNSGEGRIYLKYNDEFNGENFYDFPASTKAKPDIYVNGTKKEFSSLSLSAYNVINYMESPAVGGPDLKVMYVTTGAKTGRVTAVLADDRMVELGEQEMCLTNEYADYTPTGSSDKKAPFEMDDNYTYYLDCTGQIAAVNYNAASQGSYEYGYAVAIDSEEETIWIVKKNGTSQEYNLKNKVKVDGESKKSTEVEKELKDVVREELAGGDKYEPGTICQPIKFSASSGEISAIDTVRTNDGGSGDSFVYNELYTGDNADPTKTTVKIGDITYSFASTTTIMYVPNDRTSLSRYSVMTASKAFTSVPDEGVEIEIFDTDDSGRVKTAGLVLIYGNSDPSLAFSSSSPYILVTKISGDDTIVGYKNAGRETTEIKISESRFTERISGRNCVDIDEVSKGDLIRVIVEGNEVIAIEMIYDADETTDSDLENAIDSEGEFLDAADTDKFYVYYAEAFEKNPDENKVAVTTAFDGDEADKLADMEHISVNATTTYYSFDGNDIVAGDTMDVIEDEIGDESRLIYIRTSSKTSAVKMVYVLN